MKGSEEGLDPLGKSLDVSSAKSSLEKEANENKEEEEEFNTPQNTGRKRRARQNLVVDSDVLKKTKKSVSTA